MSEAATNTRALLLDIEGTVTPISFVHDILFPFARNHVRDYLVLHASSPEVIDVVGALRDEYAADQERDKRLTEPGSIDSTVAYVNWLIDRDRKSPALKSLQGMIWKHGYEDGSLKAPLFDDVVPSLQRLRTLGIGVAIFSSGSVLAQKLLFAHTESGDHTDLIDAYFDTAVGNKVTATSYLKIADQLRLPTREITFVSDITNELQAAREAGMATFLCVRPGNKPQVASEEFELIKSFSSSEFKLQLARQRRGFPWEQAEA